MLFAVRLNCRGPLDGSGFSEARYASASRAKSRRIAAQWRTRSRFSSHESLFSRRIRRSAVRTEGQHVAIRQSAVPSRHTMSEDVASRSGPGRVSSTVCVSVQIQRTCEGPKHAGSRPAPKGPAIQSLLQLGFGRRPPDRRPGWSRSRAHLSIVQSTGGKRVSVICHARVTSASSVIAFRDVRGGAAPSGAPLPFRSTRRQPPARLVGTLKCTFALDNRLWPPIVLPAFTGRGGVSRSRSPIRSSSGGDRS